jgi:ubiquinol-cytochrome c reductase cytochrome b subunit
MFAVGNDGEHLAVGIAGRAVTGLVDGLDQRLHLAGTARKESSHVFPKHHSFLWGEIALYSFAVLLLTGTVLALHFVPDTTEVVYDGPYADARGLHMSRAYQSALRLSFEVDGGLFIRQVHHWAAVLFVAAIVLHMFRNFFTGAFRRPRELTWVGGVALLGLAIVEGYSGYSMIDDLLSGMGVRIMSGLLLSVPVAGTWLHWMVFGGEFPGEQWIPRFYLAHVFLLPGLLVALIAGHLALVWYLKHTQFPGGKARETNVVGDRAVPGFATKTLANGLCVVGVLAVMGGVFQINPVFLWGPYSPSAGSVGAQPDWYALFLIGALRVFPRWDIDVGPYTVPAPLWPALVLPLVLFGLLAIHPFAERLITRDRRQHQLLQRPRDAPWRTGIGAMAIAFWLVLTIAGADDILAVTLDLPLAGLRWAERIALFGLPPLALLATVRICRGLQRRDRDVLERGVRTGVLDECGDGVFVELRQPPGGLDAAGRPVPLAYEGVRVEHSVIEGER